MSKGDQKLFVGDINGDPINGTAWRLHCHKAYIFRTVLSSYARLKIIIFRTFCSFLAGLVSAETKCMVPFALPKRPKKQFKPFLQIRQQGLRAYCPNIYIV